MNKAKTCFRLAGLAGALSTGAFFLSLILLIFFSASSAAAAGTATVTEVHEYPGAVEPRAPQSAPAGMTNLLDRQQPAYDGVEYELESITVEKTAPVHTIMFIANGGAPTPPAQSVEHGERVTEPNDPARDGYAFDGWYAAADFSGSVWDFENDTVSGDMTLYAKWTPQTFYVVVFVANGGVPAPPHKTVPSGQTVARPGDPARDSYVFAGWYVTWDFSGPSWDFDNDVITGNTILYARWILPTMALLKTDPSLDSAKKTSAEGNPIARASEPEPGASPVSLDRAPSLLNATTVWTIGQPGDDANFTFEEGYEYRVTYYYKAASPDESGAYTVTERYQNQNGNPIRAATERQIAPGKGYRRTAPVISGYAFAGATLDGAPQSGSTVVIADVLEDYSVVFTYRTRAAGDADSPDSNNTPTENQPTSPTQPPELDINFDDGVPLTGVPKTGAHRGRAGIVGAMLLLCGLAAGWFRRRNGK